MRVLRAEKRDNGRFWLSDVGVVGDEWLKDGMTKTSRSDHFDGTRYFNPTVPKALAFATIKARLRGNSFYASLMSGLPVSCLVH